MDSDVTILASAVENASHAPLVSGRATLPFVSACVVPRHGLGYAGNGLAMFKRGWASETRRTYFCGRIFDRAAYETLAKARGLLGVEYFPVYRCGEFG